MSSTRRIIAVLLAVTALGGTAVATEGCGATGHLVGGIVAHHIINHFVHSAAGLRRVNKLFCIYHGHRILVDVHNHHFIAAGLNGLEAYRACKGGFGHH